VLHRVKEERNVLHTVTRKKGNWIGHILRRNCLSETRYRRNDTGNDTSDGKTKKKW